MKHAVRARLRASALILSATMAALPALAQAPGTPADGVPAPSAPGVGTSPPDPRDETLQGAPSEPGAEPKNDPAATEQRKEAIPSNEDVNPPGKARAGKLKPSRGKVEKRAVPDYDGRAEPTTAGDVALWVPRLALSPLYLLSEYVIRRPIGTLVTAAERANLPKVLYDFFTFGEDHKAGFAPIAFFDFGFRPSVGLYIFWDDAFFKGHDLRLHGSTWTGNWLALVFEDRIALGKESTMEFEAALIKRPDHVFYGLGPSSLQDDRSRYSRTLLDGSATYSLRMWRSSSVHTRLGVRRATIGDGSFGDDPSLSEEAARGTYAPPPAFGSAYTAQYNKVLAALDSRRKRPAPGSGVRIEGEVEHGTQINEFPGAGWLRYGGSAGFFYDLNGRNRVVSLSATALFSDPIGRGEIPFTELVQLGGLGPMRGYWPGRLVDRSAAVFTARYKWPIWGFLDGAIEAAVGNVFGERLEAFDPKLFRFSSAIGISTVGSPDASVELLVGVGTETFDSGGKLSSLRVLVGTNRGF